MNSYNGRVKEERDKENKALSDSYRKLASVVMGREKAKYTIDSSTKTQEAVSEILKWFHLEGADIPEDIEDINKQLVYLLTPHGIMRRHVVLTPGWRKNAAGIMLAFRKDDHSAVTLIPKGIFGYHFYDSVSDKYVRLSKADEELFETKAILFFRPLPDKKLGVSDLLRFAAGCISKNDIILYALAAIAVTLLGLLVPGLNFVLFNYVSSTGNMSVFWAVVSFMISISISTIFMKAFQSLVLEKIKTKIMLFTESAAMMRVLSLPASFFRKYSSGDVASRMEAVKTLCSDLITTLLSAGLTSLLSLLFIFQIFNYASALVTPVIIIIIITVLISVVTSLAQMKVTQKKMELHARNRGQVYSILTGIQKIRNSGAEKRAFSRWLGNFAKEAKITYDPAFFLKINQTLILIVSLIGNVMICFEAFQNNISPSQYYSFSVSYGIMSGAFLQLIPVALLAANIRPGMELAKPILETEPEVSGGKHVIEHVSGDITLKNISFRYEPNRAWVIDNMSLKIKAGQYIAITGPSGCGKSTLLRLLIGLESPQKGYIYYDKKDLSQIELKSLRKKIGVVLQEGKLFDGDVYSNIAILSPGLSMEDAWKAAEIAGIADDIKKRPMGMYTQVSSSFCSFSGGQIQRILIARAIASKPNILLFDEATSALDNVNQKQLTRALDQLHCTRIVIAHRLSTIQNCDRVIYMEKGRIVEDGTYEELISKNGKFAGMIRRQQISDDNQHPA